MSKTAFITGASRGIGRAIALAFSEKGYNVAVNCLTNIELLDGLVREITGAGRAALSVPCDVSDYEAVQSAVRLAESTFGGIDILVNNAGISYVGPFNLMEPEQWRRLVDVNLHGVLNAARAVLPGMLSRRDGTVINISSVWGSAGASCEAVYSMTKGGVNAFTRALAKETAPNGVRVNAIACGVINTEMNAFLSEEEAEALTESIPMRRAGTAKEAAELALFLASPESGYVTGQIIALDGGMA